MTFCCSIYLKKVTKLLSFIFEQPSYTKFTTKSEDVVACGSCEIFIYIYKIPICDIYMFTVCTHFVQCIKIVYCMIMFHMNESNA